MHMCILSLASPVIPLLPSPACLLPSLQTSLFDIFTSLAANLPAPLQALSLYKAPAFHPDFAYLLCKYFPALIHPGHEIMMCKYSLQC